MTPYLAEFIGTAVLLYLGCGVNANVSLKATYGNGSGWIVISFGWAMAVFVAVFIAADASGAHLNPAVTLALAVAKNFPWAEVPGYVLAQIGGAFFGAVLAYVQYRPHYATEPEPGTILGTFATGPAIPDTLANVLSEVVATFVFVLAVLFLAGPSFGEQEVGLGSLDALPVALVVLAIGLSVGGTTGYAINPARDLGPRIAHAVLPIRGKGGSNWSYAWIPFFGPLLGAALSAGAFILLAA
ncbi:MIP/aquaporin family protein [Neolewinella antarctica]|uniref:Glycerol uptake facilitator protein n=1 Tax=Neolewinella antarctica TaxID=442734 RepID=A0ABX0X7B0_9BACT|nr:MIP/aquaporin family protein [Neolewinella antarctica]NJC25125.1 glycerol uptake facilitator protein [Neolewinella antarctica]